MDYTTDTCPRVTTTIVDNSPKLLAETLIEIGKQVAGNKSIVESLQYTVNDLEESLKAAKSETRGLGTLRVTLEQEIKKRVIEISDLKREVEGLAVDAKTMREMVVIRDSIIEGILREYKIKPKDKKKIKELRSPLWK